MSILGRLLRKRERPLTAPLGDSLLLTASRRRRTAGPGTLRASIALGGSEVSIRELSGAEAAAVSVTGLEPLLDELIPHLDRRARSELLDFVLAGVGPGLDKPGGFSLAASLRLLHERLRDPLPELVREDGGAPIVVIDVIVAVDDRSFWVLGWCAGDDGTLARVELVSPEGQRAGLLEDAYRFRRPDVEETLAESGARVIQKHGYSRYVKLPAPSLLSEGWRAELRGPSESGFQVQGPPAIRDPVRGRNEILLLAAVERADVEELRRDNAYPALKRLQSRFAESIEVDGVIQHGETPVSPEVSIVVTLYKRIDLLEHQLAQFWQDPELHAAELIYVLDSPEQLEQLTRLAGELHELYGIPFKIATLSRNAGYSIANNLGASLAGGRLLLLLNSDVLPEERGWLGRLQRFYDATPDIGALGPKLLFEDDSIQHAGMYFKRDPATRLWENQHYFKGFNRSLAAANVSRSVPAVTGACLMVDRALYTDLGGLNGMYVVIGFEDSDLCLRLIEAGRRNWYLADVELYHLEAQSIPIHLRAANRYNSWLQTHLWSDRIEEVMQAQPDLPDPNLVASELGS
jgi:GT2 family glycosyltransferase